MKKDSPGYATETLTSILAEVHCMDDYKNEKVFNLLNFDKIKLNNE